MALSFYAFEHTENLMQEARRLGVPGGSAYLGHVSCSSCRKFRQDVKQAQEAERAQEATDWIAPEVIDGAFVSETVIPKPTVAIEEVVFTMERLTTLAIALAQSNIVKVRLLDSILETSYLMAEYVREGALRKYGNG